MSIFCDHFIFLKVKKISKLEKLKYLCTEKLSWLTPRSHMKELKPKKNAHTGQCKSLSTKFDKKGKI